MARARVSTRRKPTEQSLHIGVVSFLKRALPPQIVFFHPPNGGKRAGKSGSLLKAMGMLAGVPDLVFVMPNGQAAFIELKTPTGEVREEQIEFQRRVRANGCAYATCRSFDEVETTLVRWLAAYGLTLRARTVAAPLLENAQ